MNLKDRIRADIESHELMACHNIDHALAAVNFARIGNQEDGLAGYSVTGGVATVKVRGLLVPHMEADYSDYGITGYNHIAEYITRADNDPAVREIVLDVDSGGGYVAGISDPTKAIADTTKPIETFVSGSMYSAAYWLGATADTITARSNSGVGSIGVYNVHVEKAKAYEERGVKFSLFRSGKWKGAFNDFTALSEDESAALQASVDESAQNFFNHVAVSRNLTASTVSGWEGGTFDATTAKDKGLIDNIANQPTQFNQTSEEDSMTLEQALAENKELQAQLSAKDAELQAFKATQRTDEIKALAEKSGREFTAEETAQMQAMDSASFKLTASFIPAKAEQPQPNANALDALFGEQALQGKTVETNDNLDANIAKWAGV